MLGRRADKTTWADRPFGWPKRSKATITGATRGHRPCRRIAGADRNPPGNGLNSLDVRAISITIQDRIESLGGLHNAVIASLTWSAEDRSLRIAVNDINSNIFGLPEYPGPSGATFVSSGVAS
jgi:hypothetical protein